MVEFQLCFNYETILFTFFARLLFYFHFLQKSVEDFLFFSIRVLFHLLQNVSAIITHLYSFAVNYCFAIVDRMSCRLDAYSGKQLAKVTRTNAALHGYYFNFHKQRISIFIRAIQSRVFFLPIDLFCLFFESKITNVKINYLRFLKVQS